MKLLYDLLPEIYRTYDGLEGRPLKALMSTLQAQYDAVDANIAALYEAWFIETCPTWAVPYIGALLGVTGLDTVAENLPRQRARVGNTQLYRSRKGAMAVLGRAAGDACGWSTMASDNLDRLVCSQDVASPRPSLGGSADLKGSEIAIWVDTPFSKAARSASFRSAKGGPFVPGAASLSVWRLQAYPIEAGAPRHIAKGAPGYAFSPMGVDTPLFTLPQTPPDPLSPLTEAEIPLRLDARRLAALIARKRRGEHVEPPFRIRLRKADGHWRTIPLEAVATGCLADWATAVPQRVRWGRRQGDISDIEVIVDPERGRFQLRDEPDAVAVDYAYGFGLDIGGGPYDRRKRMSRPTTEVWTAVVAADGPGGAPPAVPGVYKTLTAALADWALTQRPGCIRIADNAIHPWPQPVALAGTALTVEAANGCRPCVLGPVAASAERAGALRLSGLWIEGRLLLAGDLRVSLEDCTIWPVLPGAALELPEGALQPSPVVTVSRCIARSLMAPVGLQRLVVADSIVDGGRGLPTFLFKTTADATDGAVSLARTSTLGALPFVAPAPHGGIAAAGVVTDGLSSSARALAAGVYGQPAFGRPEDGPRHEAAIGQSGAYYGLLQGQRLRNIEPVVDEFLAQQLAWRVHFVD